MTSVDRTTAGFTIAEAVMALFILSVAATGTLRLIAVAIRATAAARTQTSTTAMALDKAESLKALTWTFGPSGEPWSDATTDLAGAAPGPGGAGLSPSPAGSLAQDISGYVDYLDAAGGWMGRGPGPPPGAAFVRRWSVRPLADDGLDTLVVQVLVTTRARSLLGPVVATRTLPGDARLAFLLTRKAR